MKTTEHDLDCISLTGFSCDCGAEPLPLTPFQRAARDALASEDVTLCTGAPVVPMARLVRPSLSRSSE